MNTEDQNDLEEIFSISPPDYRCQQRVVSNSKNDTPEFEESRESSNFEAMDDEWEQYKFLYEADNVATTVDQGYVSMLEKKIHDKEKQLVMTMRENTALKEQIKEKMFASAPVTGGASALHPKNAIDKQIYVKLNTVMGECKKLEKENAELENQIIHLRSSAKKVSKSKMYEEHSQTNQMKMNEFDKENRELLNKREELEQEIIRQTSQIKFLEDSLSWEKETNSQHLNRVQVLLCESMKYVKQIKELEDDRNKLKKENQDFQEKLVSASLKYDLLKSQFDKHRAEQIMETQKLSDSLEKLRVENCELFEVKNAMEYDISKLKSENEELSKNVETVQNEKMSILTECKQIQEKLSKPYSILRELLSEDEHESDNWILVKECQKLLEIVNFVGRGSFGHVYQAYEAERQQSYALKVISCQRELQTTLREVKALQRLNHERIVRYVDHWDKKWWWFSSGAGTSNKRYLFILTEFCEGGSLSQWLENNCGNNIRSMVQMKTFFLQILEGVIYIHDNGFIHRDLKPSNIFISSSFDNLKIGDFGLVKECSYDGVSSTTEARGTPIYRSPEQSYKGNVNSKTDIFPLGTILFELFYPKSMDTKLKFQVLSRLVSRTFPDHFREKFPIIYEIIIEMLAFAREKRPSAREVLERFDQFNNDQKFVPISDEIQVYGNIGSAFSSTSSEEAPDIL